ncbi:MAG: hypothetical protein JWR16_1220 [Nevskia sp.]|nr:hypothetical protein [Nevskia sp.]
MGVLWFVNSPCAELVNQTFQKKLDGLSVAKESGVNNIGSINHVGGGLINKDIGGALIAHRHSIKAFPWMTSDARVVRPCGRDEQSITVFRPSHIRVFCFWRFVAH